MKELALKMDQRNNGEIIKHEIESMNINRVCVTFINPERLLSASESIRNDLNSYLQKVWNLSIRKERNARFSKDSLITEMGAEYPNLIRNYANDQLSRIVLRKDQFDKIKLGENGRLVRDFEPVYQKPMSEILISGPFFGATKSFARNYFPTIFVNVAVIWIMTLILFILLYFNGLKYLLKAPAYFWRRIQKQL